MKHRWQGRPGLNGSVCARCGLTLEWLERTTHEGRIVYIRRLTSATGEEVPTPGRKMPPCSGRRPTKEVACG